MECLTCKGTGQEAHPCPFREELDDDAETKCNCCDDCTEECAMNI